MTQKMKKCANSANVEDQNDDLGTVTEGSVTMQLSFAAHHPLSKLFCHRSNPTTREVQWHRRCSNMPTLHVSRIKQLVHDTLSNYSTTWTSITRSKDDPKILTTSPHTLSNLIHWYQPHLDKAKWQSMTILSDWMCDDCVESTPQNTPTLLGYPPTWPEDHLISPKTNRTLISNET